MSIKLGIWAQKICAYKNQISIRERQFGRRCFLPRFLYADARDKWIQLHQGDKKNILCIIFTLQSWLPHGALGSQKTAMWKKTKRGKLQFCGDFEQKESWTFSICDCDGCGSCEKLNLGKWKVLCEKWGAFVSRSFNHMCLTEDQLPKTTRGADKLKTCSIGNYLLSHDAMIRSVNDGSFKVKKVPKRKHAYLRSAGECRELMTIYCPTNPDEK